MNKSECEEEKIVEFLMSYQDIVPSSQEKTIMVGRVEREIAKGRLNRLNMIDILFALLFVPVTAGLLLFNGMLPGVSAGQQADQIYIRPWFQLYVCMVGLLITPLLLTLLPVNKGGNR